MGPLRWKILSNIFLWHCLSCCARYNTTCTVCNYNISVRGQNPKVWPFKWTCSNEEYFQQLLFVLQYTVYSAKNYELTFCWSVSCMGPDKSERLNGLSLCFFVHHFCVKTKALNVLVWIFCYHPVRKHWVIHSSPEVAKSSVLNQIIP